MDHHGWPSPYFRFVEVIDFVSSRLKVEKNQLDGNYQCNVQESALLWSVSVNVSAHVMGTL